MFMVVVVVVLAGENCVSDSGLGGSAAVGSGVYDSGVYGSGAGDSDVVSGMKTPNDHAEPTRVERKEIHLLSIYNYTMRHINTKCKYFHLNIHLCIHVNV